MRTCKTPICSFGYGDYDDDFEFEEFLYELAPVVENIFITGYVKCIGENMGWMSLSGYKVFKFEPSTDDPTETSRRFLSEFTPNCDWHCKVYKAHNGKGLYVNVVHHDNPVSGDRYYLTPITERTYNRML